MSPQYVAAIQAANGVIMDHPEAIDLNVDQSGIRWNYTSPAFNKARKELRVVLNDLWQSGAYNYSQIARSLRIDEQTLQGLLDEEFIQKHGL